MQKVQVTYHQSGPRFWLSSLPMQFGLRGANEFEMNNSNQGGGGASRGGHVNYELRSDQLCEQGALNRPPPQQQQQQLVDERIQHTSTYKYSSRLLMLMLMLIRVASTASDSDASLHLCSSTFTLPYFLSSSTACCRFNYCTATLLACASYLRALSKSATCSFCS